MRWQIYFESLWTDDIGQLVDTSMPGRLTGKERNEFAKNKMRAAELLKSLFPPDEDTDGIS